MPGKRPFTSGFASALLAIVWSGMASSGTEDAPVSFSRDILPVLSDRCFHCHGPDPSHRKAKLRLDLEDEAKRDIDGVSIIAPGDLDSSELWYRLVTEDEDELMPPPDSHRKPLTESERKLVRRWIEQGAVWGKHWAFEKPVRPPLPDPAAHPVDSFLRDRLAREGLEPSPPAPQHVQQRRLSFALTGLPPAATIKPGDKTDWPSLIESLLASPHHAERLAMWWLDAARYSDTDGYQGDRERTNWPWRDWVIDSFASNKPFDQFTIEQFAGDLLPDATPGQILATCFHRNHMTNGEGGRDPEESRIDYVIDRVNTTGTVWLGLTLGCTQCHDHKFDPVSQKDYYSLFAFFNSIDEDGKAGRGAKPYLDYQSPHAGHALKEMEAHVASRQALEIDALRSAEARFGKWLKKTVTEHSPEYRAWHPIRPSEVTSVEGTKFRVNEETVVQAIGPNPRQDDYRIAVPAPGEVSRVSGWKLEVFPHESHTERKLSLGKSGEFILTNVKLLVRKKGLSQVRDIEMKGAVADYEREAKGRKYGKVRDTLDDDPRNGWTTESGDSTKEHTAVFELEEPLTLSPDEELVFVLFHRSTIGDANIGRFRISVSGEAGETVRGLKPSPLEDLAKALPAKPGNLDGDLRKRLLSQFLLDDTDYQKARTTLDLASRQLAETKKSAGKLGVMVLAERKEPRPTHILERGVWDAKGSVVQPGVLPAVLEWPSEKSGSRLDFARWLVSPENPLTARVVVNHLWQIVFGSGLVRTPEDFGLQGEAPTHPELLDWLAVELVENNWDIQHILRLLVSSDTFRQSSDTTAALEERDPENRLLARAPRFRLPSWMIRDNALAASGLLNPSIGGPPVNPWQPEGVWEEIFMGGKTYIPSVGPAQYRRTIYAYWRRSSAPTFLFDSAQRRVCEVRTRRTNTPLHALTLMNDTTMLEASRVLAEAVRKEQEPLQSLANQILSRKLDEREIAVVLREQQKALDYYQSHPREALTFSTIGQQDSPPENDAPAIAAWMTVASLLLNLDEAMTHE
ncbi:MAG: PSD1 and planctomycete cytochrome C domain-containing protein [Verrucomicrobiales bacterium]|nr:PSD1 and planctomycete cytochrome C domain-containing protein [Verrucomicrobiales bacterium]